MPWQPPSLTVKWGPYFKPDPEDQQKVVKLVQESLGGTSGQPLITLRTAVEKIAAIFGIENVDAALDALEAERVENDKRALEKQRAASEIENASQPKPPGTKEAAPKTPPVLK